MLIFDGLSLFLVSWMLSDVSKEAIMQVLTPFHFSKGASRAFLYQDSIFVTSNCKIASPESMLDCWQGCASNTQKQGASGPCFSVLQNKMSCHVFFGIPLSCIRWDRGVVGHEMGPGETWVCGWSRLDVTGAVWAVGAGASAVGGERFLESFQSLAVPWKHEKPVQLPHTVQSLLVHVACLNQISFAKHGACVGLNKMFKRFSCLVLISESHI